MHVFHLTGNTCTCSHGVAETGPNCPVNGGAKCLTCYSGWTMNPDRTKCICTYIAIICVCPLLTGAIYIAAASTNLCRVGDAVKAKYEGDGKLYGAHTAQTGDNVIIVHWNDGGTDHRRIFKKDVFKKRVSCDLSTGRSKICLQCAAHFLLY